MRKEKRWELGVESRELGVGERGVGSRKYWRVWGVECEDGRVENREGVVGSGE